MGKSNIENCLVRVTDASDPRFLKADCGQALEATDTPSDALLLDYDKAIAWCSRLRKKGYPRAVVCGADGELMTYERLRDQRRVAELVPDDLPHSYADLDALPASQTRMRYKTDSAFADAVDAIESQPRSAPKPRRA